MPFYCTAFIYSIPNYLLHLCFDLVFWWCYWFKSSWNSLSASGVNIRFASIPGYSWAFQGCSFIVWRVFNQIYMLIMQSNLFTCSEGILTRNRTRANSSLPSIKLGAEFAEVKFLGTTWWLMILIVSYYYLIVCS